MTVPKNLQYKTVYIDNQYVHFIITYNIQLIFSKMRYSTYELTCENLTI